MTWPLAAGALLLLALFAACWLFTNIVFHPPKKLSHTIWPDRFQLPYEAVEFPASDGTRLKGWLIPAARPTERCVLLLHGWGDNKGSLLLQTYPLRRYFNLFFFDHRHHGESEGSHSTVGYLEARDIEGALVFLKRARPAWRARLGVYGKSMGAAVAARAAATHPEIRCAVLEAPFPSFNGVVTRFTSNNLSLPHFPLAWLGLKIIRWRLEADPEPYSPIYHIARIAPRPLLFIAGSEDRLMPLSDVRVLYEAAGEPKELWVVEGASHGACAEAAKEDYHDRLREFFDKHIPEEIPATQTGNGRREGEAAPGEM